MRKILVSILIIASFFIYNHKEEMSGAPPYGEDESQVPPKSQYEIYRNWKRPDVPPRVGLQVGHWKNEELPDELSKLHGNTGAKGGGKWEWEVNHRIAEETKILLEEKGIEVDILPATVPPKYWADVFLAIHADGNLDKSKTGFKFASPWRDFTRKADSLVNSLNEAYSTNTNLDPDPNITKNMRGYYAFSWWKYEHSIDPMTTAAIAETGFLTNPNDQKLLIYSPEIPAKGIAEGIINYLLSNEILSL